MFFFGNFPFDDLLNQDWVTLLSILSSNYYFKKKSSKSESIIDRIFNYCVLTFSGSVIMGNATTKRIHFLTFVNLDILLNREITIIKHSTLLILHFSIFLIFQHIPIYEMEKDHVLVSFCICLIDSYSKSRSISNSIKKANEVFKDDFCIKFLISLLYNQLGKYLFERFFTESSKKKSFYKNSAILLITFLNSTTFSENTYMSQSYLFSTSLILLISSRIDSDHESKNKARLKKQGQYKLLSNAKTR